MVLFVLTRICFQPLWLICFCLVLNYSHFETRQLGLTIPLDLVLVWWPYSFQSVHANLYDAASLNQDLDLIYLSTNSVKCLNILNSFTVSLRNFHPFYLCPLSICRNLLIEGKSSQLIVLMTIPSFESCILYTNGSLLFEYFIIFIVKIPHCTHKKGLN